ncbi:MAG: hypothetical protein Aureis2KO_17310 [Aureisphaera sp.]
MGSSILNKLKTGAETIKEWFWALPLWKRAIFTSIIGIFGGSSVIGFLNKYALYLHAIRNNFRVPVEGVEYLDLSISLVSAAFLTISVIGTIIIYNLLRLLKYIFSKFRSHRINKVIKSFTKFREVSEGMDDEDLMGLRLKNLRNSQKKMDFISNLFGSIFGGFLTSVLLIIASYYDNEENLYLIYLLLISIIPLAIIIPRLIKNEVVIKQVTLGIILIAVVGFSSLLFIKPVYNTFLSGIKYGGEILVKIEYRKADNTVGQTEGQLLIRTKNSITIRKSEEQVIEEIPTERISRVLFPQ